jgi:hypothetical protein
VSIDLIAGAAAGPFAAACVVLVFAGVSKIRRPAGTRPALAALGLPASPAAVRTLGMVEATAAGSGLAAGGAAAIAVGVVYGALAVVAWRLFVRSPGTGCGCMGASETPVAATHIVVNVAAAIAALLASGAGGTPLSAVGSDRWSRVAFVLLVGCCAWLVAAALDTLPALNATVREGSSR